MTVPEGGGSVSTERVKLYLERHPEMFNLGSEIDFHDGYVGEDWPRRGYALTRKDVEDLLNDMDDLTDEFMEVKEAYNNVLAQKKQWAKDRAEVERLTNLVRSMQLNGARHHFQYGYQKWSKDTGYVDYCTICDRDKEHPAHFVTKARYLDSRKVEEAAQNALERLEAMLTGLGLKSARAVAQELLYGLPGIEAKEGP